MLSMNCPMTSRILRADVQKRLIERFSANVAKSLAVLLDKWSTHSKPVNGDSEAAENKCDHRHPRRIDGSYYDLVTCAIDTLGGFAFGCDFKAQKDPNQFTAKAVTDLDADSLKRDRVGSSRSEFNAASLDTC